MRMTFFSPGGDLLFIEASGDLFVVNWADIVENTPADKVLAAWSSVLSGQQIDEHGGTIPLNPQAFRRAWETIRDKYGTEN